VGVGLLMIAGGAAAGVFGSLLGLGGGILIVPLLTLGFGLELREAVGVSLVSVIMTSSAAAGVYLERHVANLRLGMSLELFTAVGALVGGSIAFLLDERWLSVLFAGLLLYVALTMLRATARPRDPTPALERTDGADTADPADDTDTADAADILTEADPPVAPEAGDGRAWRPTGWRSASRRADLLTSLSGPGYAVRNLGPGIAGAAGAGVLSALLGIGGGIVKVPLMHLAMGVPLRVAAATSNLMIGITAAASAVIYLLRGEIDPYVAGPTAIGVFVGATIGSRVAHRVPLRYLRLLFVAVLLYTAVQMIVRAAS
jgi:uncharacterized membrane protein YfcA